MSEKRRDNKGRILKTGESQRKDGRYAYKYTDAGGKPQFVYAWKLVVTDKTPAGKRDGVSLREKEKEIRRDIEDGIDTIGKKMTVCQLYAKQNSHRQNVKLGAQRGREYLMGLLRGDPLGSRSIDTVKLSDAKEWAIRMSGKGFSYQSICNYKRSLKAAFYTAIEDDCIRKNPFNFALNMVLEDDREPKAPLTAEQEAALLSFVERDKVYCRYREEIIILLGTGLRISELCGLTEADLDFDNRLITVDHQLLHDRDAGYYVEQPKTKNGVRQIPMSEAVYSSLQRAILRRGKTAFEVDSRRGFLFLKGDGTPNTHGNYNSTLRNIVKKYNKLCGKGRLGTDVRLPHITPHILRHTFCTRMANAGMNPKALQYIMGHGDVKMTLNYYAHATYESAKAEMDRLTA